MSALTYDQVTYQSPDVSSYFNTGINAYQNLGNALKAAGEDFQQAYQRHKTNQLLADLAAARDPNNLNSINDFMKTIGTNYVGADPTTVGALIASQSLMNEALAKERVTQHKAKIDPLQTAINVAYANGDPNVLRDANIAAAHAAANMGLSSEAVTYGKALDVETAQEAIEASRDQRRVAAMTARANMMNAGAQQRTAYATQRPAYLNWMENMGYAFLAQSGAFNKDADPELVSQLTYALPEYFRQQLGVELDPEAYMRIYRKLNDVGTLGDGTISQDIAAQYNLDPSLWLNEREQGNYTGAFGSFNPYMVPTSISNRAYIRQSDSSRVSGDYTPEQVAELQRLNNLSTGGSTFINVRGQGAAPQVVQQETENGTVANGGVGESAAPVSTSGGDSKIAQSLTQGSEVPVEGEQGVKEGAQPAPQYQFDSSLYATPQANFWGSNGYVGPGFGLVPRTEEPAAMPSEAEEAARKAQQAFNEEQERLRQESRDQDDLDRMDAKRAAKAQLAQKAADDALAKAAAYREQWASNVYNENERRHSAIEDYREAMLKKQQAREEMDLWRAAREQEEAAQKRKQFEADVYNENERILSDIEDQKEYEDKKRRARAEVAAQTANQRRAAWEAQVNQQNDYISSQIEDYREAMQKKRQARQDIQERTHRQNINRSVNQIIGAQQDPNFSLVNSLEENPIDMDFGTKIPNIPTGPRGFPDFADPAPDLVLPGGRTLNEVLAEQAAQRAAAQRADYEDSYNLDLADEKAAELRNRAEVQAYYNSPEYQMAQQTKREQLDAENQQRVNWLREHLPLSNYSSPEYNQYIFDTYRRTLDQQAQEEAQRVANQRAIEDAIARAPEEMAYNRQLDDRERENLKRYWRTKISGGYDQAEGFGIGISSDVPPSTLSPQEMYQMYQELESQQPPAEPYQRGFFEGMKSFLREALENANIISSANAAEIPDNWREQDAANNFANAYNFINQQPNSGFGTLYEPAQFDLNADWLNPAYSTPSQAPIDTINQDLQQAQAEAPAATSEVTPSANTGMITDSSTGSQIAVPSREQVQKILSQNNSIGNTFLQSLALSNGALDTFNTSVDSVEYLQSITNSIDDPAQIKAVADYFYGNNIISAETYKNFMNTSGIRPTDLYGAPVNLSPGENENFKYSNAHIDRALGNTGMNLANLFSKVDPVNYTSSENIRLFDEVQRTMNQTEAQLRTQLHNTTFGSASMINGADAYELATTRDPQRIAQILNNLGLRKQTKAGNSVIKETISAADLDDLASAAINVSTAGAANELMEKYAFVGDDGETEWQISPGNQTELIRLAATAANMFSESKYPGIVGLMVSMSGLRERADISPYRFSRGRLYLDTFNVKQSLQNLLNALYDPASEQGEYVRNMRGVQEAKANWDTLYNSYKTEVGKLSKNNGPNRSYSPVAVISRQRSNKSASQAYTNLLKGTDALFIDVVSHMRNADQRELFKKYPQFQQAFIDLYNDRKNSQ